MKILYIASDTCWGGSNVALYNLLKTLLKNNVNPIVVLPKRSGPLCEKLDCLRIPWFHVGYKLNVYPNRNCGKLKWIIKLVYYLIVNKIARKRLSAIIKKIKPDIIHTNVGPLDLVLDICKKNKIPHVWHIREYNDKIGLNFFPNENTYRRKMYRHNNFNIAITKGIFEYYGMRSCDKVIYDGVLDENRVPKIFDKKKDLVVFIGRLERNKQTHVALNSFLAFHKQYQNYRMKVVGDFSVDLEYTRECLDIIKNENAQNLIEVCGQINNVSSLYKEAKAVIIPSLFEGFGFVAAEAMLYGCIVLGKNSTGTKEQLDKGLSVLNREIGFRFDSEEDLVMGLCEIAQNYPIEMLADAQKIAMQNYTTEIHSMNVLNYYNEILQERGNV